MPIRQEWTAMVIFTKKQLQLLHKKKLSIKNHYVHDKTWSNNYMVSYYCYQPQKINSIQIP